MKGNEKNTFCELYPFCRAENQERVCAILHEYFSASSKISTITLSKDRKRYYPKKPQTGLDSFSRENSSEQKIEKVTLDIKES